MSKLSRLLAACSLCCVSFGALSEPLAAPVPQNQVQLSAQASVDVEQDLLTLTLSTSREGTDPVVVQNQLKQALDAALAEARKSALAGQLEMRTGNFNLSPRYGRDGKMTGWHGSTELVLEGRDFARIGATAGRIETLTMGGVNFGLSREQRDRVEGEVQARAIERFKAKAKEIAGSFGFSGYGLREVSVNANDQVPVPRPRMMAMEAKAASADMPISLEAGKSTVTVTVSGSVQLR